MAKRMYEICLYKCQIADEDGGESQKTDMNSLEGSRIKQGRRSSIDAIKAVQAERDASKEDTMLANMKAQAAALLNGDAANSADRPMMTPEEEAKIAEGKKRREKVGKTLQAARMRKKSVGQRDMIVNLGKS